jgi:hypothetical protein
MKLKELLKIDPLTGEILMQHDKLKVFEQSLCHPQEKLKVAIGIEET